MPPTIAFTFHSSAPSGATLWLIRFITEGPYDPRDCFAILPGEASFVQMLRDRGVRVAILPVQERALTEVSAGERIGAVVHKLGYANRIAEELRSSGADLVYVNCGVQVLPGYAARRVGLPVVWHIHEAWGRGLRFALKRSAARRWSDAMLFDAAAGRQLYEPIPDGKPAVVVPNGVPESFANLRSGRDEIRTRMGWEPDDLIVLFVGSIIQRKGVHDLLEVWSRASRQHVRARLVLAGGEDPNETHPLLRALPTSPPEGVTYLGLRKDIPELMAAADLMVLPSYGEAMPISISEAMMIGCPVVARAVADVPFQIGEGRGFLFSGDGPAPLEAALGEAMASPQERTARAAKAQDFARAHLTWSQQCSTIRDIIESVRKARAR